MKTILALTVLIATTLFASAQYVVTNPVSDVLAETMHLEDIAKWVESINNQVQQIQTLTAQLQQAQAYVKAFGDPEQLLNIVGADALMSSLQQSGVGQTIGELQQLADGVQAFAYDANDRYGKKVTYVTKKGKTLSDDEVRTRIKVGSPVSVHYKTEGDNRVIERVEIDDD